MLVYVILIAAVVISVIIVWLIVQTNKRIYHASRKQSASATRMNKHLHQLEAALVDYQRQAGESKALVNSVLKIVKTMGGDSGAIARLSTQIKSEKDTIIHVINANKVAIVDAVKNDGVLTNVADDVARVLKEGFEPFVTGPKVISFNDVKNALKAALDKRSLTYNEVQLNTAANAIVNMTPLSDMREIAILLQLSAMQISGLSKAPTCPSPCPNPNTVEIPAQGLTSSQAQTQSQLVMNMGQALVKLEALSNALNGVKDCTNCMQVAPPYHVPVPPAVPPALPMTIPAETIFAWTSAYLSNNVMTGTLQLSPTASVVTTWVPTYIVDDASIFKTTSDGLLGDLYDNGLVLAYASAVGLGVIGHKIAQSMMILMSNNGWISAGPTSNERTNQYRMMILPTRFNKHLSMIDYNKNVYFEGDKRDIGNVAMAACGLCKFGAAYKNLQALNASLDLALTIHVQRAGACPKFRFYMARTDNPSVEPDSYAAFEHHIDLYALATMLLVHAKNAVAGMALSADETAKLEDMQIRCKEFADYVWDETNGCFKAGAAYCNKFSSGSYDGAGSTPADTQTWMTLSGISEHKPERITRALQWTINNVVVRDSDTGSTGCSDGDTDKWTSTRCNTLPPKSVLRGLRFSDQGAGIQWENTGSGVMALTKGKSDPKVCSDIVSSISSYFSTRKEQGLLASFQSMDALAELERGGFRNTGFGWSYYASPHTAGTIYCALAAGYNEFVLQGNPAQAEIFNPYSPIVRQDLSNPSAVQVPSAASCPFIQDPTICPVLPDTRVGEVWGYFENNPDWFTNVATDTQYLPRLALPIKQAKTLRTLQFDRNFKACSSDVQRKTLGNMFKAFSSSNACP